MLRPERMARALIAGPREKLASTIEVLHSLKLLHIVDHHGDDDVFRIGKPLPQASELSDSLVKLRSVSNILGVQEVSEEREPVSLGDLRQRILSLELNITEEDSARKKIESLLSDLHRRIEELRPFSDLGLPLELYRGYDSIAVFVGRVPHEATEKIREALPESEIFGASGVVAVFVTKERSDDTTTVLGRLGFSQLEIPKEAGEPKALLNGGLSEEEKWRRKLEEVQGRLEKLRERYAGFILRAQELLVDEVEKAEAPLRFAVSEHTFVIDGWVPAKKTPELSSRLGSLYLQTESGDHPRDAEGIEPPVLLKNPKPVKPFEMLIQLYSTPSYHELDPTLLMLVAFPIFFGFMIGDAGYGGLFFLFGLIALFRIKKESDFRRLLLIISVGGLWALIFGLFVFGEMFGMPFHLPPSAPPEELAWDHFGLIYPISQPLIHKSLNIGDMFYLSILFGAFHLGTSYVLGFVNEVHHSKKHALAKVGWFLCLFGIFTILTRILSWTRTGGWVWNVALAWFPRAIEPLGLSGILGVGIPLVSFLLIFGALLGFAESPVALLEVGGLLANLLSYLRLAGIGIGKATIAITFNTLILHGLVLDQSIPLAIVGFVLLVLAQLLVFLLGAVSAGIQGVRLNYVESFTKFFKGNGTMFQPFGTRKPQEA